jgi:AbrB family looped-hinge helix DNA binding protein
MYEDGIKSGRVTKKGQVTIPAEVRKELGIDEGDRIDFVREINDTYKIQVIKKKSLKNSLGKLSVDHTIPFVEERHVAYKQKTMENVRKDLDKENYQ